MQHDYFGTGIPSYRLGYGDPGLWLALYWRAVMEA